MVTIKTTEAEDAKLSALAAKATDAQMRGTRAGDRARVMALRAFERGLAELEREAREVKP